MLIECYLFALTPRIGKTSSLQNPIDHPVINITITAGTSNEIRNDFVLKKAKEQINSNAPQANPIKRKTRLGFSQKEKPKKMMKRGIPNPAVM